MKGLTLKKIIYVSYYDGPYRRGELNYEREIKNLGRLIHYLRNNRGISVDEAYECIRNSFSSVVNYKVVSVPEESNVSKFVTHKDLIKEFIPNGEVKMVILGTMASCVARSLDDKIPESFFYYHSNLNRFWDILTYLYFGERKKLGSIEEKKIFLNQAGIALSNLVAEAKLQEYQKSDDTHLFEAFNEQRLFFKTVSPVFKSLLREVPVFFTCYRKKPIERLLEGFYLHNGLPTTDIERIKFLHSPTRRSYEYIAGLWRESIELNEAA